MGQSVVREDLPARQYQLDGADEALVLVQHDPITNYPLWAQLLLQFAYWATGYSGEAQLQAICTSEEEAAALAIHAGYRAIWLPINDSLPEGRVQWRPPIHFKSPLRRWHMRQKSAFVAVRGPALKRELDVIRKSAERLETIVNAKPT